MDRRLAVWVIGKSAWVLDEKSALGFHRSQSLTSSGIQETVGRQDAARPGNRVDPSERQRLTERLTQMYPIDPRD